MNYLYDPNKLYPRASNDELYHWKYIKREKIAGKWRYYYKKVKNNIDSVTKNNMFYDINSWNYNDRKNQIQNTDEWKKIVSSNDPEYVRTKEDGSKEYLYDKYLMNKKHPVLDAMYDMNSGRNVSLTKQSASTFIAGAKDYINMGIRTVQNILSLGVGIISLKLMNQQGSLDNEKNQIKTTVSNAGDMVKTASDNYSKMTSKVGVSSSSNDALASVSKYAGDAYNQLSEEDKKKLSQAGSKLYNEYKKR